MPIRLLEHVSVWIDDPLSSTDVFPQAMQWALCLGLPLRVVVTPLSPGRGRCPSLAETMRVWSATCAERGVVLETSFWLGGTDIGMTHFLRACGLCVLVGRQLDRYHEELLARCNRRPGLVLACCPPRVLPLRGVAVLYEHLDPRAAYLESAAHLCAALGLQPLIVTVARTSRDAALKRSHAEGVCASLRLAADFEQIVDHEPCAALRRLLTVWHCSHLLVERSERHGGPLFDGDWLAPWRGLCDKHSILALPDTAALDLPAPAYTGRTVATGPHRSWQKTATSRGRAE